MEIIKKINDRMELDILSLIKAVLHKIWLVIIISLLCGTLMFGYTYRFKEPVYEANISLYVSNNRSPKDQGNLTTSDISASYMLLQTYATVIKSDTILKDILILSGTSYSVEELANMIKIDAAENTPILFVSVSNSNPEVAALLANCVAESVSNNLRLIVWGSYVTVLDYAVVPEKPVGPSYSKSALAGVAIGFVLSVFFIILLSLKKQKVRNKKDVQEINIPILGWLNQQQKSQKGVQSDAFRQYAMNIMYSLPAKEDKMIVFTSSSNGEERGDVLLGLSKEIALEGNKTLLIDFDLRDSELTKLMEMDPIPGVTEAIIGSVPVEKCIRKYDTNLHVITSGAHSLNPLNLISPTTLEDLIRTVKDSYRFIFIAAPSFRYREDVLNLSKSAVGVIYNIKLNKAWVQDIKADLSSLKEKDVEVLGLSIVE